MAKKARKVAKAKKAKKVTTKRAHRALGRVTDWMKPPKRRKK
jgi:hypothetical protein